MKSIGHEVAGIYASRNGNETNHQVTSPLENEKRERSEKNTRKFGRFILLFSQLKRLLFFFSTDKLHVAALRVPANLN